MPRPIWSGTISFGLVAIPIKLYNGVSKKSVSFNQLDERTMSRIKLKKVSAGVGDDVPDEHIVKGYEISKGRYVVVDPDELEPFIPSATKSIDLEEFVDLDEIDPVYFDSPYIVAPDKTPKPYMLLARAMEQAGKVAIGRFVMRNKQYVCALRAVDGKLMMSTMVFADEVVPTSAIDELETLDEVEVSDKEVLMAEALVESLSAEVRAEEVPRQLPRAGARPHRTQGRRRGVRGARRGRAAPQVIDLMAALEASVRAAKDARKRHPAGGPDGR
jgi:DNA end-binding protein Ku